MRKKQRSRSSLRSVDNDEETILNSCVDVTQNVNLFVRKSSRIIPHRYSFGAFNCAADSPFGLFGIHDNREGVAAEAGINAF